MRGRTSSVGGLRDELQTGWSASNWASSVEPPKNIALALTGG
ncbi:hypothetical protein PRUB_a2140 [Pseudoalteromonas rubra]|uniref:Uncharacterized protein n=1 Tax=Pseudoalteromonas rubra TaxID=43658 RepID=A0A8T0CE74_9GAMM|nr:hypothetical protein PRUB_a2140 [Pseudoalteromonas rubra]